jgi:hypothetical protein
LTYFILFFLKSDNDVTASGEDDITTKLNFVQDIETSRKMCYKNSFYFFILLEMKPGRKLFSHFRDDSS